MKNKILASFLTLALLVPVSFAADRTKLADAAMHKDQATVRLLLKQHEDANAPQADGTTALMWAVRANDEETVDLLLAAGADANAANRDGATAMYQAAANGEAAIVEKLLKAGVDPNARFLSAGETAIMEAARVGSVATVKVLLDRGADANAKENLRETTALMWASSENHPEIMALLLAHGANINAHSKSQKEKVSAASSPLARLSPVASRLVRGGLTPLVFAVREEAMDAIKTLVAAKANLDETTADGSSALLVAVQNGFYEIARFLIQSGANINLPNQKGWSPLYLAVKNRTIETGQLPTPPNQEQAMDFIKFLLAQDAEVNGRLTFETEIGSGNHPIWLREEGATPFLRAAWAGDPDVMKLLLAHGADPGIPTVDHTTPLMALAGVGFTFSFAHHRSHAEELEALNLLLDLGGDVNASNDQGVTALMGAAHIGGNDQVQILVNHGAKLDAHDKGKNCPAGLKGCPGGATPLTYAYGLPTTSQAPIEQTETVALLRKMMTERGIAIPSSPVD